MFYGPLSELYGRKTPLFLGYTLFVIFQIPVAVAVNVETIMLFRFLGGVAASGPLSVAGGYLADFFDPVRRGLALAIVSGTTLVGILTGPFIGGFVVDNE
jgi:DHA1 family multidrug resistance protein-like MFS transporter